MKEFVHLLTSKHPIGIGDYIKGSRGLLYLSNFLKNKYNLAIDINFGLCNHSFSGLLNIEIYNNIDRVYSFFESTEQLLIPFLISSKNKKFITTNCANLIKLLPESPIDRLKNTIKPTDTLLKKISCIMSEFDLNEYDSVHLRLGDIASNDIFYNNIENLGNLFEVIEKTVPIKKGKIIILSDSQFIRTLLSRKYGFIDIKTVPSLFNNTSSFLAENTLLDFFIMSNSNNIYCTDSNFSNEICTLYGINKIPLHNIFFKHKDNSFVNIPIRTQLILRNENNYFEFDKCNKSIEKL